MLLIAATTFSSNPKSRGRTSFGPKISYPVNESTFPPVLGYRLSSHKKARTTKFPVHFHVEGKAKTKRHQNRKPSEIWK